MLILAPNLAGFEFPKFYLRVCNASLGLRKYCSEHIRNTLHNKQWFSEVNLKLNYTIRINEIRKTH